MESRYGISTLLVLSAMTLLHVTLGEPFKETSCSHAAAGQRWYLRDATNIRVYYKCGYSPPKKYITYSFLCACVGGRPCNQMEGSSIRFEMKRRCKPLTAGSSSESSTPAACTSSPCKNSGTCQDTSSGGYKCKCRNGYYGKRCQKDACRPSPCLNGGYCRRKSDGDFSCSCRVGYSGKKCEKDVCALTAACQNGGSCNRRSAISKTCICKPGYHGSTCETNACDSSPCQNNGRCEASNNARRFTCVCEGVFTGDLCEVDNSAAYCEPNPCEHSGVCTPTNSGPSCKCADGYSGATCTVDICYPNPCRQGGQCSRTSEGYSCSCPAGYSGKSCEVDACEPNPCSNDGTCLRTDRGTRCACENGYLGQNCDIDACNPNPCLNGAKCVRRGGAFSCACEEDFTGRTCGKKVVSYTRCRFGFASVNDVKGGQLDEEQCSTVCYVREDSNEQTVQRGCWNPSLFNDDQVPSAPPAAGCGFFNDQLEPTDSNTDILFCFCKPGKKFCNDGSVDSLIRKLPKLSFTT